MAWYFQSSPHDTHDWDATQTPVLFDGEINGQKRKLVAQASRNGYFFVLDRATGKNIVTTELRESQLGEGGGCERARRFPNPAKEPQLDGALVTPNQAGARQLAASELQPRHRPVLRQRRARVQRLLHLRPERQARRLGRQRSRRLGRIDDPGDRLQDRQDQVESTSGRTAAGRACSRRPASCCSRATARATWWRWIAATGNPLWHANLGASVTNGPITYELDGTQYLVVAAGDSLFAFVMRAK